MKNIKVTLKLKTTIEIATLQIYRGESLTLIRNSGSRKKYVGDDLFLCLAEARRDHPDIEFLCKGAKLNVFPSRMSSQMSGGIIAYELTLGIAATFENTVNIFDFDDQNICRDLSEQQEHYKKWLISLGHDPRNQLLQTY